MTKKPKFKIEIESNDISQWVIVDNFLDTRTDDTVGQGVISLDLSYPFTLQNYEEIKFYLTFDSEVHLFTGIITSFRKDDDNKRYIVDFGNSSFRYLKKTATNKFRSDLGNGNAKTIVTSINDEYVPEITYDDTTIPDTTYEFLEQAYQNKYINEIYDFIAELLDRQWWVDKDKKLHLKTRDFPLVSEPITNANIIGSPTVDKDVSKFANYVSVDGAKIPVDRVDTGTVSIGSSEFSLTHVPASFVEILINDSRKSIAKEGSPDYSDSTLYDGYIKVAEKKIKFNTSTFDGDNGTVTYQTFNAVHDEVQDGASRDQYNITVEKTIENEEITSQADAFNIGQNYLNNYSQPLEIISLNVFISSQSQITNWQIGNKVPINFKEINGDYKIVGVRYNFGVSGIYLEITTTDFPDTSSDLLKRLLLRVKKREEREKRGSDSIVKYFFWGGNLYFEVENISVRSQYQIGDKMIWGHPDVGRWGSSVWGAGSTSEPMTDLFTINSSNGFTDNFDKDHWFADLGSSDSVFFDDSRGTGYEFAVGSSYFSNIVDKDESIYTRAKATAYGLGTSDYSIQLINSGTDQYFEAGTTEFQTLPSTGTNWKYKAINNGSGTSELTKVNIQWL